MALGTTAISAETMSNTANDGMSYSKAYDVEPHAHERVDRDAIRKLLDADDAEQKQEDDVPSYTEQDASSTNNHVDNVRNGSSASADTADVAETADITASGDNASQSETSDTSQVSSSRIDQSVQQLAGSLDTDPSTVSRQDIVDIAMSRVGNSYYQHAGLGPSGFSCDGFTAWVYSVAGVRIFDSIADSSAGGQSAYISSSGAMKTNIDELQPGDVLFFGSSWSSLRHAAIYIGKSDDGTPQMAHASGYVHPDGTQDGVVIGQFDADFLGGGSPLA